MTVFAIMLGCIAISACILIYLYSWKLDGYEKDVVYYYTRRSDGRIRILFFDGLLRIWKYEFPYEEEEEACRIYEAILDNKPYSIDQEPQLHWD